MKQGMLLAVCFSALAALVAAGSSLAGGMGHGSMSGGMGTGQSSMSGGMGAGQGSMSGMHAEGTMEGHGMMKMGDKVFEGKIGSLHGEARLVDMKAQMAKSKVSAKMMANMKNTHHVAISLTNPATKEPVTKGSGTVTVAGPDGKAVTTPLMGMQGHFGADVNLPAPGQYAFRVEVDAGGEKGTAAFSHTVK